MISYIGARIVGTAYLQGIDHASIPWPMVSDKGGGKIVPATPSEIYFASQLERREKGKRVIISYTWEKGTYNHDDIITLERTTQQNKGGKREEKGIR